MTAAGNVKINGKVVTTLGRDVADGDVVEVNGQVVSPAKSCVYIALNKPKGYITTVSDEQGRPTVMDLVADVEARVFPVGRLDADTTGLLIMTSDGDFGNAAAHPKHEVYKTYRARVEGIVSHEKLARLRRGVEIDGRMTSPAKAEFVRQSSGSTVIDISIREGRNRQVRKMVAAIGSKVIDLQRISIGDVKLGGLKAGHWRKLTRAEIDNLR
jgi:23S rRNA pseudouridine2605 synthase